MEHAPARARKVRNRPWELNWAARRYWRCVAAFVLLVSFLAHAAAALPPLPAPTAAEQKACTKPGRTGPEVQVCLSPQVWARAVVGAMQTGLDDKGRPTGRIFHVLVVGPGYESVRQDAAPELKRSLQDITGNKVVTVLQRQLDRTPSPGERLEANARANPDPNLVIPEALTKLNEQSAADVLSAIQGATINYRSATRGLFDGFRVDSTKFQMAISESACLPSEGCVVPEWALDDSIKKFHRYSKLLNWQRQRGIPPGQLQGFVQQDAETPLATGPMQGVRMVPASAVTPEVQVKNFERLVNEVRRAGPRYPDGFNLNSAVPSVLGLSKRGALAVVDLLQSPVTAINQLPANGTGTGALNSISDELARTRITECSRLRGQITPAGIGDCAGYALTTPQEVADCMSGLRCFPKVGNKLTLDALLIADPKDIRTLVTGVALPRIKLADDIGQLKTRVNECTAAKRDKTEVELTACLAEKQAPAQAATFKCARNASGLKGAEQTAKLRDCLASSLPPEQRKQLDCYVGEKSTVDKILCTSEDKMSPEARAVAECVQEARADKRTKRQMELCLLNKQVPGAGQALACFKEQADWKAGLACSMKGQVGGDVGKALDCAAQNNYKAEGTAVCMVKLPGDLGKLAQCAAQSGGNPYGTAVCAVGGGLTVDQRIALQCAAQSGGAPPTFAACLAGQMTMKELGYCKGKSFGEDKCFNENNEFRKLFAQAGVPIGPKSVVADVINVHLKYLEAQVALFSDLNEDAKRELTNAAKVMTESYRAVLKAHESVAKVVVGASKGMCTGVAKALFGKKKRC